MNAVANYCLHNDKIVCEICFKFDEFYVCNKCFQRYLEKTVCYRKSVKTDKYYLKSSIQEIINKNYHKIVTTNKISQRRIKLEHIQRKINDLEVFVKVKQNMIIVMKEKINKKKEYMKKMKELTNKENSCLVNNKFKLIKGEELLIENKKISDKIKISNLNFLSGLIFSSINFDIKEYFEVQEYVKPDLIKTSNSNNDVREFDKIPNILSVTNLGTLVNYYHKEYDINYDKIIQLNSEKIKNKSSIYRLNNFIYSVILFQNFVCSSLGIPLTYTFEENNLLKIKNEIIDCNYTLYLDSNPDTHNENYLNELMQGYSYLDKNLKNILNYLKPELKSNKEVKKYKKGFSFTNQHNLFTHDLTEFLNISKIISDKMRLKEKEIKILEQKNLREDDGFVLIDNYYV